MKRLLLVVLSLLAAGCDENNTAGDQLACLASPCTVVHIFLRLDGSRRRWIAVTTYRGLPPDTVVYEDRNEAIAAARQRRALNEGLLHRRGLIYVDTRFIPAVAPRTPL